MKLAIYTQQLEYMGGIERVVLEHLRIFATHGVEVLLLLDHKPVKMATRINCQVVVLPASGCEREDALRTALRDFGPDYLIMHGESHPTFDDDIAVINELSVKSICVAHFPFVTNIMLDGPRDNWKCFGDHVAKCSAVATVSKIDALFWRAQGRRAFHVQNPFVHPKNVETIRRGGEDDTTNLIWVGRHTEQKQPSAALAAFALVEKACPNVHLYMLGGSKTEKRGNVDIIAEQPDINAYWAKADIHLLTSVCESFCLVWAEAKAAGIPTVMFDLPYLELAEDGRGYVAVEQRNVRALAGAIIDLVKNPEKRRRMGEDAKASLERFNDDAVWQSWQRLFDALKRSMEEDVGYDVDPALRTVATQMKAAYSYHFVKHHWETEMVENMCSLTRNLVTMRGFARFLRTCILYARMVKGKLHGHE